MSLLVEKQHRFAQAVANLIHITRIALPGYRIRFGEGYVGDTQASMDKQSTSTLKAVHIRKGVHFSRLAVDFVLDRWDGKKWVWVRGEDPSWERLGSYWKKQDPDARWGGDFASRDLNHFSFIHGGVS